jgi:hypothetical protein
MPNVDDDYHGEDNQALRKRSGEVSLDGSKLTSFLYQLMRDHVPAGVVEQLVCDAKDADVSYSNGWLAKYAKDVADRLSSDD